MSRCNIHFIGCLSSLTHPLIRNKMSSMNGNGSLSMEKILNISGAPTLSEVTCLDISGLELKTKDLKVLLSLSQLEELNVSDNDLKGFPVDLTLPKLRKLNCSKNVLRSVDFVTQFPKLEVLLIESNIVNICEQYIAIHVLPSLVEYNGEATKEVRQIIEEYEYRLLQRLSDTWNEQFAILLPCQFSALEANHIERKLRRDLQNVPCGPSSLQHFKDHLIFHIVRRHMLKIKIEQSEIKQEKRKMKSNHDGIKKKIKLESVSDNGLSSTKKNKIHGSGLSHSSFVPVHFLKCHSKNNDPGDDNTRVWRCAFEPNPLNSGMISNCCVYAIAVIPDFYALAWTTVCLDVSGNERPTNLLAVAGMRGEIRMLYPSQLVCYSLLRDYKRSINTLIFHPQKPTWLF
ncbi:leucine-rich repeat and WD repeat-containing protein 1-like, partial [Saccoglossus kowalevskii]